MKRNLHLLAIPLFVAAAGYAGSARADDITIDPNPFVSSLSRAQVQAELEVFRRSGIDPWARFYNPLHQFQSTRSRAEVTAEYIRDRDEVAATNGEDGGSAYLTKKRQQMHAPVYLAADRTAEVMK